MMVEKNKTFFSQLNLDDFVRAESFVCIIKALQFIAYNIWIWVEMLLGSIPVLHFVTVWTMQNVHVCSEPRLQ